MELGKVAVVTGSNNVIGYDVVKGLCEKYNGTVYLSSRDSSRGEAAVATHKEQGLNPRFYQLDVSGQISVNKFRNFTLSNDFPNKENVRSNSDKKENIYLIQFFTMIYWLTDNQLIT